MEGISGSYHWVVHWYLKVKPMAFIQLGWVYSMIDEYWVIVGWGGTICVGTDRVWEDIGTLVLLVRGMYMLESRSNVSNEPNILGCDESS